MERSGMRVSLHAFVRPITPLMQPSNGKDLLSVARWSLLPHREQFLGRLRDSVRCTI
jgi:hypothetical protein